MKKEGEKRQFASEISERNRDKDGETETKRQTDKE